MPFTPGTPSLISKPGADTPASGRNMLKLSAVGNVYLTMVFLFRPGSFAVVLFALQVVYTLSGAGLIPRLPRLPVMLIAGSVFWLYQALRTGVSAWLVGSSHPTDDIVHALIMVLLALLQSAGAWQVHLAEQKSETRAE